MVASLQSKKEALEAKLRDKTSELRKLCIEEAELTGVLPTETPLEPGESPPQFRRRVGTAFTYPESLINKLRSKEDEALAALELECKIQTGIAEAAKGLANDGTASKSVRRKHRLLYEDSQRRLSDLEARLAAYRQAQPKQKKKPRPLTEFDETVHHDVDEVDSARFPSAPSLLPDRPSTSIRHSHTYGGLSKQDFNMHPHHHRVAQSQMHLPVADYRYNLMDHHHHYIVRSNNPSPIDHNVNWNKGRDMCNNHHQPPINQYAYSSGSSLHDNFHPESVSMSNFSDRFGSLDRSSHYSEASDSENRISATLPRNSTTPHSTVSVLLPNQTYPESSLMRTQSLGNMDNLKNQADRKNKEKEWYETSLDSSPAVSKPDSPFNPKSTTEIQCTPPPQSPSADSPLDNCMVKANQASINNIHFDTVVPYESPKNHTVVQAGKWQPYREVTKPFEMSDFYKYSTKYRQQSKGQPMPSQPPYQTHDVTSTQHKGVYKAPMPLECQPLSSTGENANTLPPISNAQRYEEHNQPEAVTWYRNKNIPKPRSSTLV
ncbi:hypothetical protein GE061_000125 [Apolygus lucorum]|uniref:Cytohesin Ubiquitin Protein Inducing domain-containing protein n=1 Tax=Apolygus lucorum TaxID=248454 RepID=A0A8S9Y3E1_APOLU|nr:hypothetical protein GE061_000125 [Apolygus lucorum]